MKPCNHPSVTTYTEFGFVPEYNQYQLEVTLICDECERKAKFKGMPKGMSPLRPMTTPDTTTARLPVVFEGGPQHEQ